jgi:hypothetical protein
MSSPQPKLLTHREFFNNMCIRRKHTWKTTENDLDKCLLDMLDACKYALSPVYILLISNFANTFFVTYIGGTKPAGFLIGDIDEATKRAFVYVLCSSYGKGVGTSTFEAFEMAALEKGVNVIEVEAIPSSRDFYLKKGFKERARPDPSTKFAKVIMYIASFVKKSPGSYHMKKVYRR